MRYAVIATLVGSLTIAGALAQDALPSFDVASVKPSPPGDDRTIWDNPTAETFAVTNAELRPLIARAYGIEPMLERFVLVGGPEKTLSLRFDIRAKPEGRATPDQRILMLRSLLASRFKLRTHTEIRVVPIFALTLARDGKFGPNFRKSEFNCSAWRLARSQATKNRTAMPQEPKDAKGRSWCTAGYNFSQPGAMTLRNAGSISELSRTLQAFLERPLIDATNLEGNFEWQIAFAMGSSPADSPASSLPLALQDQLGLKVESRRGPLEVRIIDGVEMPSPD
jgi:uncharacterized protein (TIGR03435 family)